MRLLTQNLLICNRKGCGEGNFPLRVQADKSEVRETPFRKEMVLKLIEKIDWLALHSTVTSLGEPAFPLNLSGPLLEDEQFLRRVQRVVYDTHILEGRLVCGGCKREYPIVKGIPNMILEDAQV